MSRIPRVLRLVAGGAALALALSVADLGLGLDIGGPSSACAASDCEGECACIWGPIEEQYFCEYWKNSFECSEDSQCEDDGYRLM